MLDEEMARLDRPFGLSVQVLSRSGEVDDVILGETGRRLPDAQALRFIVEVGALA